jgi:uncharacterized protein YcfL
LIVLINLQHFLKAGCKKEKETIHYNMVFDDDCTFISINKTINVRVQSSPQTQTQSMSWQKNNKFAK